MSLIIPELLPTTKAYGLYGQGFNYSLLGSRFTNPLLCSSYHNRPSSYNTKLNIRSNTYQNLNVTVHLVVFINTSIGVIKSSVAHLLNRDYLGNYYITLSYPCGDISQYCNVYYDMYDIVLIVDIFKMCRDFIDVYNIEYQVFCDGGTIHYPNFTTLISWDVYYYDTFTYNVPYDILPISCPTSLNAYKKTITLDKSTGFVFTVT